MKESVYMLSVLTLLRTRNVPTNPTLLRISVFPGMTTSLHAYMHACMQHTLSFASIAFTNK